MSIPGRGDLSPPRRYRYGRRRRRWPRVLLTLLVLAALGAGGYYGWHRWRDDRSSATVATTPCPSPTPAPSNLGTPSVAGPPIRVLNGNLRPGLAGRVARALHQRFRISVAHVGNATRFIRGPSEVRYPSPLQREALQVAAGLVPPPTLTVAAGGKVEVDLGTKFRRVATPAEYDAAFKRLLLEFAGASPSPSPTPTPTATISECASP